MKMEDLKYTIGGLMLAVDSYFYDDFIYFWKHDEEKDKITKACLSQWYPSTFIVDGATYNCAAQYMMAEKARIFGMETIKVGSINSLCQIFDLSLSAECQFLRERCGHRDR